MSRVEIVMFCDLVDSTALLARLGDERMDRLRRAHIADVRASVTGSGGRVVKTLGDGAMATFGSALGAMRAAAAIQASTHRLDQAEGEVGIAARVGIAAGEPIADGDDVHGMSVVIASRLCGAAETGGVLVQDLVYSLVASRESAGFEPAGKHELKGVPGLVRAAPLRWQEMAPVDGCGEPGADQTGADREEGRLRFGLPSALAAYAEEPLVGREAEIAALRETSRPHPGTRAALVLGEPGIGKTRHVAAAAAEAHARGELVVLARCPPEASIAFEPWVRAIGELARSGDEEWRARLAKAAGAELSTLIPELAAYEALAERAGAADFAAAEGSRYRVLRGIAASLAFAAGDAPLQVVLDDAHWCDRASAQALGHLLDTASGPLLVVVTAREGELGRRHPVSRVLLGLRRTGDLEELRLEGLGTAGLARLVDERIGRAITPALAARLAARTGGNPFFAAELIRELEGRGVLGEPAALESAPVPDAVADLVEERLARLEPETEGLLCAAAAIGPTVSVALAQKAADLGDEAAERAMGEALSERLIEELPWREPTIAFPHALVREALGAATEPLDRARLHLRIATLLEEDPDAEAAELARHHGASVTLAGPDSAIAAYLKAAAVAARDHDHEQATAHLGQALGLLGAEDVSRRAPVLLELGEQELLSADMRSARRAFRAAGDAARALGDAEVMARAALGFAGGDIGFGYEIDRDDRDTVALLREALEALGEDNPRLSLRMVFRLVVALSFSEGEAELRELRERAEGLDRRLGDAESRALANFTRVAALLGRGPDPLRVLDHTAELPKLAGLVAESGRDDLHLRLVQWSAYAHYLHRDVTACDAAIEECARIAARLGSPRFAWEIDLLRGQRLLDRGEYRAGEELIRRAGAVVGRLRPDIQIAVELLIISCVAWFYDGEGASLRYATEAAKAAKLSGFASAGAALVAALDGDLQVAGERLTSTLAEGLEALRRPDVHVPAGVCALAFVAAEVDDRAAATKLREELEPLRPYLPQVAPLISFGDLPEWHIGRLELVLGRPERAVEELREAVREADRLELGWLVAMSRIDLARALRRRGASGDDEESATVLAEAERMATQRQQRWVLGRVLPRVKAELGGRVEENGGAPGPERAKTMRALATRGARRALLGLARDVEDAELERRFADPRRQRALLRGMARGFQAARAGGFNGTIAYELEPHEIEPPPDSPWRWAITVDAAAGQARLLEAPPLDAELTIHIGLAQWVRVLAGLESPLEVAFAGLCRVEGDVLVAARLEAMFGG